MGALVLFVISVIALFILDSAKGDSTKNATSDSTINSRSTRILGGKRVTSIKLHPYMSALEHVEYIGKIRCGASIIHEFWLLTAAHCLVDPSFGMVYQSGELIVIVGILDIRKSINQPRHAISKMFLPHGYDVAVNTDDIGLIYLAEPLKFSSSVNAIKLPSKRVMKAGPPYKECLTIGWGNTMDGNSSDFLRVVDIPIITSSVCKRFFSDADNRVLCGMGYNKSFCVGDGGGPLIYKDYIIGIISWVDGCQVSEKPGIFTRVAAYMSWIYEIIPTKHVKAMNSLGSGLKIPVFLVVAQLVEFVSML